MRTKLLFAVKFLLVSLVLYLCKGWIMVAYEFVLLTACSVFLPSGHAGLASYYDSSFRTLPFLALVLATPKLSWRRRGGLLLTGVAVFWAIDLAGFLIWTEPPSRQPGQGASRAHILFSLAWETLGHWVLPYLLWFAGVHRQLGELFGGGAHQRRAPSPTAGR
ncbi:hypothetical protein [uncultured Desulfuromonas sp.]|uniref:hypothetical protein n=1 Tax=uncultured Desulfuromonas sp. TaxID=181013 RepID=UPI00260D5B06|nr:hypothetical protein [uncultured Desulfuromonas sp.]